jgi:hypothetical protein
MASWKRVCAFLQDAALCISAILDDTLWDIVYRNCLFWSAGLIFSTKLYGTMVFSLLLNFQSRVSLMYQWRRCCTLTPLQFCCQWLVPTYLHCSLLPLTSTTWFSGDCAIHSAVAAGAGVLYRVDAVGSARKCLPFFVSGCVECKHKL